MTRHVALHSVPPRDLRLVEDILDHRIPAVSALSPIATRTPDLRNHPHTQDHAEAPYLNRWGIWSGL